jgi:medium-chain acyl-[acyl-carrier-protein] hydrolase
MKSTRPKNNWVSFPRPNPDAALRIFFFPYAGGNSLMYRTWPEHLPASVEVCAVQLPGREARLREPSYRDLPPLVEALADALPPHLDKPFAFFGHSMGALISFELSRELRRRGGPTPSHLFVSGHRAPQIETDVPPTYDLPTPEFLEEIRRFNGTPREVLEHPELMQLFLPLLRSDFALCQTYVYRPEPPLDCPINVYGGVEDRDVPREHLEAWREQTSAAFTLRMFPGDHFFLRKFQPLLLDTFSQQLMTLLPAPS